MTDFVFRKSIPLPRDMGTIDVRGLALVDISALIQINLADIIKAVEQYNGAVNALYSRRSMDDFLLTVATMFPHLAAQVIMLASDRPDDDFTKLPAGVSVVCLLSIAELTLEDMSALADPSPALANLVRQAMAGVSLKLPNSLSPGSTGASDAL